MNLRLELGPVPVTDIDRAKAFYAETLGVDVSEANGMLTLRLAGGGRVLIYPKDDHQPAAYMTSVSVRPASGVAAR